jgi:hypothetical protein
MALDENPVRELFEQLNVLLAGHRFEIGVAALQDLLVAAICYVTADQAAAKSLCADIAADLQKTIDRNFEHYHDQKNTATAAKRRSN